MNAAAVAELEKDLLQFCGTETWYRHALNLNAFFTEGVLFLAENAGAYWLVDDIMIANKFNRAVKAEQYQSWALTLDPPSKTNAHGANHLRFQDVVEVANREAKLLTEIDAVRCPR
jgi:hypothetical protein